MPMEVAVLVPCLNEEAAIAAVVRGMRSALPGATVYVYDNGSTDATAAKAREAGAVVRTEPMRGKGNVVRRMFADVDADVYVLVDGDATYEAASASEMVDKLIDERLDMVSGARISQETAAYRSGHRFGNALFSGMVARIFGSGIRDMLSGYRVFSRRFVKSFPAISAGFEIETELTVHALALRMPIAEVDTVYGSRPEDSHSKLNTYRDGVRILTSIVRLVKDERPVLFFTAIAGLLGLTAVALAIPLFQTYERTGLVPRFPTAILATGIMILAFLSFASGVILDSVRRGRREMKRLHYLSFSAVPERSSAAASSDRRRPA